MTVTAAYYNATSTESGGTAEQFLERKRKAVANGASLGISLTSLNLQAQLTDSGPTLNGCPAPTEKPGQLNPAHSRWLQGLPPEWDACGVTAMPSSRRSRKRSSVRTSKAKP